jgi:hypothetical protein
LVLRIEASKSEVLLVFQTVPYSMRKALRKKAHAVYKLTRREGDEGENRAMEDEDERDKDKQSSGTSQAGSEWTSYTKYSDATSAAYLRRYNKPASVISMPTSATSARAQGSRTGHRRRTSMAQEAISSARAGSLTTPASPAASPSPNVCTTPTSPSPRSATGISSAPAGDGVAACFDITTGTNPSEAQESGSAVSARGTAAIINHGLHEAAIELGSAGLPDLGFPKSELTVQSGSLLKENLSDEDRLQMQLEGEKSMLARKAMAILLSKYIFFVLTIALYFGLSIWQIKTQLGSVEDASRLTAVASLRLPALQFSFYQARQFLFFKWDDVKGVVADATLRSGPYHDSAVAELATAQKSTRATIYGDDAYGIGMPDGNSDQDFILSGDLCIIPLQSFRALVPTVPDHVVTKCNVIENGLLHHGLYGAMDFAFEKINAFTNPLNEAAAASYMYNLPPPPGLTVADTEKLLMDLQRASVVANEYVFYYLLLSAAVYNQTAQAIYGGFRSIMTVFLVVFSLFLVFCYFALFHPISTALLRVSNSSKSMMLLLPPEVIKFVPAAKKYIDENVSAK